MWIIHKFVRSFASALEGLSHAYRIDKSFMLQINIGLPICGALIYFLSPIPSSELILLLGSYFLILIVELINTAFEKMLDKLHPDEHIVIKRSKDISAGAALVAFMFAALVIGILFYNKFTAPHSTHLINQFMLGPVAV